jgi:hypothetical protein
MRGAGRTGMKRRAGVVGVLSVMAALLAPSVEAQLDPLAFIKRVPPTVILVVDTSYRMLEDGNGYLYDPNTYTVANDPTVAAALGVPTATATTYRRKYKNLRYENVQDANTKFEAETIEAVPNTSPAYATFWAPTRLEIVKQGIAKAVGENASSAYRWGLVKHRQSSPAWRSEPNCDKPVRVTANAVLQTATDTSPCNVGQTGKFAIYPPTVSAPNYSLETGGSPVVVAAGAGTASSIQTVVTRPINDPLGLIPAGRGARDYSDRPITHALEDARAQAVAAMSSDSASTRSCRNTVVVLLAGGKDDGDSTYRSTHDPVATAKTFVSVSAGGVTKRVPIFVVGVKPDPTHVQQLKDIASASGGRYFQANSAEDVARAINLALQSGFARSTDFDAGRASEFQPVSPIVGTVNLKNAKDASGVLLPNTEITSPDGAVIPQRSNVLITAGFALNATPSESSSPGFEGRVRAFRTFRPEPDATKPSGYKFVKDGTRLWPDVDGRPETAGMARTPLDPNIRNLFTYIPGVGMTAFTLANRTVLEPYLGGADGSILIPFVRSLPLGAVIGSTPALMDPPSIDPPPDDAYGRPDAPGTYAGDHKDRRSIIWVGANDGMIHAIDARTGFEVWAFIPFNLLPKLKTLLDGQPVDQFDYFVDSSPKIAEVKFNGTTWKTVLVIGQAQGGTFYQAFDVTEAGMGGPPPDSDDYLAVLASFADPNRVRFLWSFPRYSQFDPTYFGTFTVTDGTPGGKVNMYGDLKASATAAEKTVGFTWSDPAVGPLNQTRTTNVVIVGSGYFPPIEDLLPGRGSTAPRAGQALYLIQVETGTLLGGVTSCGTSGSTGCVDVGNGTGKHQRLKNALQADPSAAGAYSGSPVVTRAYLGDIDGRYYRFDFTSSGTITFTRVYDAKQPIYSSSALLFVGSSDVYMFFATSSDLQVGAEDDGHFHLIGLKDNYPGGRATEQFRFHLSKEDELPSLSPTVAGDIAFFTTVSADPKAPCTDFSSRLYAFTYLGGAAYDTNANNRLDKNESPVIRTVAGRATAPFIVDQHLYFGTAGGTGSNVEIFGDPEDFNNGVGQVGVRILSWREIR